MKRASRLAGDTARSATTGEVRDLRREACALQECVADLTLEHRLLKKHDRGWGRRRIRYPESEKLEIILVVKQSHLPAKRMLDKLAIARRSSTVVFFAMSLVGRRCWRIDHRCRAGCGTASRRKCRIRSSRWRWSSPGCHRASWRYAFTHEKRYFVSEASVYRLLKAHDLITSPAYVVIKAADQFPRKTTRPNEMWQTDFTHFKTIGWSWMYLSTVLDDFSRDINVYRLELEPAAELVSFHLRPPVLKTP